MEITVKFESMAEFNMYMGNQDNAETKPPKKEKKEKDEKKEDTPPPPPDASPSIDDVREAVARLTDTPNEGKIPEILKKYGAEKISQLDKKDYAAVIKAVNKYDL